jgi:hypothetical protein
VNSQYSPTSLDDIIARMLGSIAADQFGVRLLGSAGG